jgi:hypothetical protein
VGIGRTLPDTPLEIDQGEFLQAAADMEPESVNPVGIDRVQHGRLSDSTKPPTEPPDESVAHQAVDDVDHRLAGKSSRYGEVFLRCLAQSSQLGEHDALLQQLRADRRQSAIPCCHRKPSPQARTE